MNPQPPASERLARAPLLVFMLVADADGKVDRKERAALERLCSNPDQFSSPLFGAAVRHLVRDADHHFEALQRLELEPLDELAAVAAELETAYPDEARAFKRCLLQWGKAVAEASGGFLGFGRKVRAQEAVTLADIALSLGLVDGNGHPVSE
jgi:hypothetical protein